MRVEKRIVTYREDIVPIVHETNRAYCKTIDKVPHPFWEDTPEWQKDSVYTGITFIANNPKITFKESHENGVRKKQKTDGNMVHRKPRYQTTSIYGPIRKALRGRQSQGPFVFIYCENPISVL